MPDDGSRPLRAIYPHVVGRGWDKRTGVLTCLRAPCDPHDAVVGKQQTRAVSSEGRYVEVKPVGGRPVELFLPYGPAVSAIMPTL